MQYSTCVIHLPSVADLPCLKKMKDEGVVPKDKLSVKRIPGKKVTTIILRSPTKSSIVPVWSSVKLTPGNVKEVKVIPMGDNKKPTDRPQTAKVTDPSKPTEIKFTKPLEAQQLIIILTPKSDKPTDVDVISVVSCLPEDGRFIVCLNGSGGYVMHFKTRYQKAKSR